MGVTRNKKSYVGAIGIEDPEAPGVAVAATTKLRYSKMGLKPGVSKKDMDLCDGTPGSTYPYRDKAEPTATIQMPYWPEEAAEIFMKLAFGEAVTTRNIASTGLSYTHEFTQDWNNALSASLYQYSPGLDDQEPIVYAGSVLKTLELTWNGPGPVDLKAEFDTGHVEFLTVDPSALTGTNAAPFFWGGMVAKIDGTQNAEVSNLSLKIEKEIDKQYGAKGDGSLYANLFTPTNWKVSGGIKFPYRDWTELRKYLTGSASGTVISETILNRTLQIINTGALIESNAGTDYKYLSQFDMPKVDFETDADKDNDKTIDYDIKFTAQKYTGVNAGLGTNKILGAKIVSKLATIA